MKKIPRVIAWLVFVATTVWTVETYATEAQVEAAIVHILEKGVPKHRIKPFVGHTLLRDTKQRKQLSRAITLAADRHDIPEMLLVAIAFRENSFRQAPVGDIDERSVFQIVTNTAKAVVYGRFSWTKYKEPECTLSTVEGAALCAAALLRIHFLRCGDLPVAVILYATGHTCKPYKPKLRWLQRDRINLQRHLEDTFYDKN